MPGVYRGIADGQVDIAAVQNRCIQVVVGHGPHGHLYAAQGRIGAQYASNVLWRQQQYPGSEQQHYPGSEKQKQHPGSQQQHHYPGSHIVEAAAASGKSAIAATLSRLHINSEELHMGW